MKQIMEQSFRVRNSLPRKIDVIEVFSLISDSESGGALFKVNAFDLSLNHLH